MPPSLALALTLFLIGYLLHRDSRGEARVSAAVWIPTLWLMLIGSRQVSQWLESGPILSAQALEEGNPLDKAVYSALIFAGVCILVSRRVRIGEILGNNLPIAMFFLYAGLSILWSDFPAIAAKRWVKALGDLVMVFVLWTDPFPVRAITAAIRRCAYVLIPLSVLFCKYYENLGRTFDMWGKYSYTGVTTDKNMLGYLLFAFGLYFVAAFMTRLDPNRADRNPAYGDQVINILFLIMIGWLVSIANSKTATLALGAGIAIIVATRFATVRRHFWSYGLSAIALLVMSDELFSVKSAVLEASGRDATFTGRSGLWETLLGEPINPLIGVGYASFWLGERQERFWAMFSTSPPIQAHNGYLEVYLNLGLVGLCLIIVLLWRGLIKIRSRLFGPLSRVPVVSKVRPLPTQQLATGLTTGMSGATTRHLPAPRAIRAVVPEESLSAVGYAEQATADPLCVDPRPSKVPRDSYDDRLFATFGLAYGFSYLLYNVTEATFQGLNFLFVIFLILAFNCRHTASVRSFRKKT